MASPNLDRIEIIEPPIEELTKKPSWLKRIAFLGCGGVIMLIAGFFVAIKILLGPGPQSLHAVPPNFPPTVPVYDKNNIDTINFTPGRYDARAGQLATIFPHRLLAPFIKNSAADGAVLSPAESFQKNKAQKMWAFFTSPDDAFTDIYVLEWQSINAEPKFIFGYYRTELRKAGFTITDQTTDANDLYQRFTNNSDVEGTVEVNHSQDGDGGGTHAVLTVYVTRLGTQPASSTISH